MEHFANSTQAGPAVEVATNRRQPMRLRVRRPMRVLYGSSPFGENGVEDCKTAVMETITIHPRQGTIPTAYSPQEAAVVQSFIRVVEPNNGEMLTPDLLLPWDVVQGIADSFNATMASAIGDEWAGPHDFKGDRGPSAAAVADPIVEGEA